MRKALTPVNLGRLPPTQTDEGLTFEVSKGGTLYIWSVDPKIFPPSAGDLLHHASIQVFPLSVKTKQNSTFSDQKETLLDSYADRRNSPLLTRI